jgi:hypothetical protein
VYCILGNYLDEKILCFHVLTNSSAKKSETTSISVVALGLDLLCRNVKSYLDAMGMSSRTSALANELDHRGGSTSYGVVNTRSGRQSSRSVNYEEFF